MLSVFSSYGVVINTKLVGYKEMEKLEELYIVDYIFVHIFMLMCMFTCEFICIAEHQSWYNSILGDIPHRLDND